MMREKIADLLMWMACRIRGDKTPEGQYTQTREEVGRAMRVPILKMRIQKLECLVQDRDITIRNLSRAVENLSAEKNWLDEKVTGRGE